MRKRIKLGDLVVDNIRYLRNKRSWTQHDLEIQADLSFNYINFIESYRFYPSYKNVEKIAKALEVEPNILFMEVVVMIKYYYHKIHKIYYAVEDNDFADVGINESDCVEVSKEEYEQSFKH